MKIGNGRINIWKCASNHFLDTPLAVVICHSQTYLKVTMNQLLIYLSDTWSFFKQHVVRLISLTLPFILPMVLFDVFPGTDSETLEDIIFYQFGLSLLLFPFIQVLVLQYISSVITGIPVSRSSHYLRASTRWLPLIGFYVISNLAVAAGIILFIVPGIVAFVRLSFGEILCVIFKKHPIDAFSQSWNLTAPYQGYLFFGSLMILVATSTFYFALNKVLMMIAPGNLIFSMLISFVSYVFNFVLAIFIYRVFSDAVEKQD